MAIITLSCGELTEVDDKDSDLRAFPWRLHPHGYVVRGMRVDGKYINIRLHRVVAERMGLKIESCLVDHKNRDKLDNRRSNLRLATNSQNGANSANADGSYKGVSWSQGRMLWQAYIKVNYRQESLGYFETITEAAQAYNEAAKFYFGEFAYLNEV